MRFRSWRVLPAEPVLPGLPTPAVGQILRIPTPVTARVSPTLRAEEQYLNTLIGSEANLINKQRTLVHATMPIYSELTSIDALIARTAHPSAKLLAESTVLTRQIQNIDAQLAANQAQLYKGFVNEYDALGVIAATNPTFPNRNAYLTAVGLQNYQVNRLPTFQFPVPPASPVNLPPNR